MASGQVTQNLLFFPSKTVGGKAPLSVYKRGKVWWVNVKGPNGQVRRSTKTSDYSIAVGQEAVLRLEVSQPIFDNQLSFKELISKVRLSEISQNKPSWKTFYKHIFLQLENYFGERRLQDISPMDVETYKQEKLKTTGPATVNRHLATLKKIFNLAVRWELFNKNPVKNIYFCREPPPREMELSSDQKIKLLNACKEHPKLFMAALLSMMLGMRRGDLLRLRVENILFEQGVVSLLDEKTKRPRRIPIIPQAQGILSKLTEGKASKDFLFVNRFGNAYTRSGLKRWFATARYQAGLENVRWHDLRHVFATDLISQGGDIYSVSKMLGHRDLKTTQRYAHLLTDRLKTEANKLGSLWDTIDNTIGFIKGSKS